MHELHSVCHAVPGAHSSPSFSSKTLRLFVSKDTAQSLLHFGCPSMHQQVALQSFVHWEPGAQTLERSLSHPTLVHVANPPGSHVHVLHSVFQYVPGAHWLPQERFDMPFCSVLGRHEGSSSLDAHLSTLPKHELVRLNEKPINKINLISLT